MRYQRKLIIVLLFLALIPAVLVCAIGTGETTTSLYELHVDQLNSVAHASATAFKEIVVLRMEKLELMSASWSMRDYLRQGQNMPAADEDDKHNLRETFELYVDTLNVFSDVMMLDEHGKVAVGYHQEMEGIDLSDMDYFQTIQESNHAQSVFVSKAHTSLSETDGSDVRHVGLAKGFYAADGSLQGVVVAFVDADSMGGFMKSVAFGETGIGFVIDVDNYIISHPELRFFRTYTAAVKLDNLITRWEAGEISISGMVEDVLDGTRRVYFYEILPDVSMAVCLRQDYDEFVKDGQRLLYREYGVLVATLILILLPLACVLVHLFLRPYQRIRKAIAVDRETEEYQKLEGFGEDIPGEIAEGYNKIIGEMQSILEVVRRERRQSTYLSLHDAATGLLNRSALEQEVSALIWEGAPFGLIYLSLSEIRSKSYMMGSEAMDSVLSITARRIDKAPFNFKLSASLGMGEFVFIKSGSKEEVENSARLFLDMQNTPFKVKKNTFHFESNIGIAFYPEDGMNAGELIANANIAMLQAEAAKERFLLTYHQKMRSKIDRSRSILDVLHSCEENEELLWMYQPIVSTAKELCKVIGFETKMRIKSKALGLMSPEEFMPIAETDPRVVKRLGDRALDAACRLAQKLAKKGFDGFVSVNVYYAQFAQETFASFILDLLGEYELRPECLCLEVDESLLRSMERGEMRHLQTLREAGVKVALSRIKYFRSSLNQILAKPISEIKFSSSFFESGNLEEPMIIFNQALLRLFVEAKLEVLVDGVDTLQEVELMQAIGCSRMQGLAFSLPLTEEKALTFTCKEAGEKPPITM